MKIEITNYQDWCRDAPGQTYWFTYEGGEYFAERWATHNTSGLDYYFASNGAGAGNLFESVEDDDEFYELLDNFDNLLWKQREHMGLVEMEAVALRAAMASANGAPLDLPDLNNLDAINAWLNGEQKS